MVFSDNLFDSAGKKISVIDKDFRERLLSHEDRPNVFEGRAIVFEGPDDYHARIEEPELQIEEQSVLIIRNCGPVGYPGSAEVVNMQPLAALIKHGIMTMTTMGDWRQSGTSGSPSGLNVSREAAVDGGLALLQICDQIRIDLNMRKVNVFLRDRGTGSAPCQVDPAETGLDDTMGRNLPIHDRTDGHGGMSGACNAIPERRRNQG